MASRRDSSDSPSLPRILAKVIDDIRDRASERDQPDSERSSLIPVPRFVRNLAPALAPGLPPRTQARSAAVSVGPSTFEVFRFAVVRPPAPASAASMTWGIHLYWLGTGGSSS